MQPLRLATDTETGFVHVLDRRLGHLLAQCIDKGLTPCGIILADPGDGRRGQVHTEQVGHQHGQTLLGQQLVVLQIEYECLDPWAVLRWSGNALGKGRFRLRAAMQAPACVGAMFGHQQRLRLGQVEHLPGGQVRGHGLAQGLAAAGAGLGEMVDDRVGGFRLAQRLTGMAWLAAGLLAGLLSQAGDAHRLLQTVAGWRFAAIAAVQAKAAFQFGDALPLRQKQRDEVVFRKLAEGGVIHRLLRIWNLPLCQMDSAPPQYEHRSRVACWREPITPGGAGQLHTFIYWND